MDFRATVRDEATGEARWFIYIESKHNGPTMACRFGQRSHAEAVANAMNRAWEREGRLYEWEREYV